MFFSLIFKYQNKFYIEKKNNFLTNFFIWRFAPKAKLEIKPIESQMLTTSVPYFFSSTT
jgi:hypothetical protein